MRPWGQKVRSQGQVYGNVWRETSEREERQGRVGAKVSGSYVLPTPAPGQGLSVEGKAPSSGLNRPMFKS